MGLIDTNDSNILSISFVEQLTDLVAQLDRWQIYAKASGFYTQSPSGVITRLLTSADISTFEAFDFDLSLIAALTPTSGKFLVGRASAWTNDYILAADIPDISATYIPQTAIGTTVEPHDANLTLIAALSGGGIAKRKSDNTWSLVGGELVLTASGGTPALTNGCAPSAKWETATNKQNVWSLDFDASAIEYAHWHVWMPAIWNASTFTYSVEWTAASGSGDVVWTLEARAYADDDPLDASWGTGIDVTDTLTAAGDVDLSTTSSAVTAAGTPAAGQAVAFRLSRKATSGSDTLAVDARMLNVKVNIGVN